MRHRIFSDQPFAAGSEITVTGEEMHHAARVVRVHEGEEVEVFDGHGGAASARVLSAEGDAARVRVEAPIASRETRIGVDLAMAIIALDRFELVLQKATELGVRSIIPLVTERVEVRAERYRGKRERWEKIMFEAVKQSGRSVLPRLAASATFAEAMERVGPKIVFDADVEPSQRRVPLDGATLFVGPEGGWSEEEIQLAGNSGCLFRTLGPRRLRAETAAIVGLSTFLFQAGEL